MLSNLMIPSSADSPQIILDQEQGLIEFIGKSYPGDTFVFYKPVLDWLKDYFDGNMQENTIVNFKLVYFNSSSNQVVFDILDILTEAITKSKIEVNWHYNAEIEDALEDYEDVNDEFPNLNINPIKFKKD